MFWTEQEWKLDKKSSISNWNQNDEGRNIIEEKICKFVSINASIFYHIFSLKIEFRIRNKIQLKGKISVYSL